MGNPKSNLIDAPIAAAVITAGWIMCILFGSIQYKFVQLRFEFFLFMLKHDLYNYLSLLDNLF
ncbi:MAG: hypothetical protein ACFWTN_08460 [Clostridium sp.]|jgi:hypothetical protein